MSSPYIKKLSTQSGKSEVELEKYWQKAKEITSEQFDILEKEFKDKHYAHATEIVKSMAGIKENKMNIQDFISSDKSVDEFIVETMTSGTVTSGDFPKLAKDQVVVKKKKEDDDEKDSAKVVKTKEEDERKKYFGLTEKEYKEDLYGTKTSVEEGTENPIDTSNLKGMNQGLYDINAPAKITIAQQFVDVGQPLRVQSVQEDIGGKFTVELRIPNTEKCTWYKFDSEDQARKAGWIK